MPITSLPKREAGKQCYVMVGSQIKYEPIWQSARCKSLLRKVGIDDKECLASATAGLRGSSIAKASKEK